MSRPEVEVQKNYTDLLDRQKQITKDNHSSANKKKSNTRHNLFCTTWAQSENLGIALKFLFLHHENILFPND